MRKIKVEPQPADRDSLWPDEDSGITWESIEDDPTWHAIDYLDDLKKGEVVSVEQDIDGVWWWVIE